MTPTSPGARVDLFALGGAQVVTDPQLTADPLAHPGQVIRRRRGDMAAMLASAPRPVQQADRRTSKPTTAATSPPMAAAPPPDRSALNAANAALKAARQKLEADLRAVEAEKAELDARERKMREAGEAQVRKLERAKAAAQRAYVKVGGEPA